MDDHKGLSTVIVSWHGTQGEDSYKPCFQHVKNTFNSVSGIVMLIQSHNLGLSQVSAEHCECMVFCFFFFPCCAMAVHAERVR